MDYSVMQVVFIFLITFLAAIDQFSFLESLYQPIVTGTAIGLVLGDLQTGLVVGGTYQLMTIGNMPIGGAQPPNAVIGGIMASVLAISANLDPSLAAVTAIPFALIGQYVITLIFTLMSPVMTIADQCARKGDDKGIQRINYLAMATLGFVFATVVILFFLGGVTFGETIANAIPDWLMRGLKAAGGMMRYVGFAILLKAMISRDMWGFYFLGFALAVIVMASQSLKGSALLLLAFVAFALAYWDFQIQTKFKNMDESITNKR